MSSVFNKQNSKRREESSQSSHARNRRFQSRFMYVNLVYRALAVESVENDDSIAWHKRYASPVHLQIEAPLQTEGSTSHQENTLECTKSIAVTSGYSFSYILPPNFRLIETAQHNSSKLCGNESKSSMLNMRLIIRMGLAIMSIFLPFLSFHQCKNYSFSNVYALQ